MAKTEEKRPFTKDKNKVVNETNFLNIMQMMSQLVDNNTKLSASILNITESYQKVIETNQCIIESNAELILKLQEKVKDVKPVK